MANSSRTFLLYFISPSMGSREGEQSSGLKKKLVYEEYGIEKNTISSPEFSTINNEMNIFVSV